MSASPGPPRGLASVIAPCPGPLPATRRRLGPLLRHTSGAWELIAVTRRGDDATAAYLAGIADAGTACRIVVEPDLKGVRAAWARGLREARGDFVALLGPATTVTHDWLEQLAALLTARPSIGMVAPSGPGSTPRLCAAGPDPSEPGAVDEFAARWRRERRGRWSHEEELSGECLVLKRGVVAALEAHRRLRAAELRPDRLSRRVRQARFGLALAHDLYVHQDLAAPAARAAARKATGRRCKVCLTMIVRDEEANLPACLESAAGLFDAIVVVDTGSKDRTIEIARSYGATVAEFPWIDDFAAARNCALGHATGDYAFWLDADDRIEASEHRKLKALFDGLGPPADAAYVVRCSCDPDPKGGGATVVDHVRLFPLRDDVRWTYRVHEQILPAVRKAGFAVRWTDCTVRHVGYNDPAVRRRKLLRDQAILEVEAAARPDEPFVRFNLGMIALELDDPQTALDHLSKSLAGSAASDSIVRKLHATMARAHQLLGDPAAAIAACEAGLKADPDDAELLFRRSVLLRRGGRDAEAEAGWKRILTLRRAEKFASVDEGIYGHLTRRNLAVLAEARRDRAEAVLHWSAVLAECPSDAQASESLERLTRPVPAR